MNMNKSNQAAQAAQSIKTWCASTSGQALHQSGCKARLIVTNGNMTEFRFDMQIQTIWQPSYTPNYAPRIPKPPPVPRVFNETRRRAYVCFRKSKTAQKVLEAIESAGGITTSDLVGITRLSGMCADSQSVEALHMIRASGLDGDQQIALNNMLDSKTRSALKKAKESTQQTKETA